MSYEDYLRQSEEELDAADLLFDKGFYKEAVSRTYYSMFHAAQALLFIKDKINCGEVTWKRKRYW